MNRLSKYLTDILMSLSNKDYVTSLKLINKIAKKDKEELFSKLKNSPYSDFLIYYNKFK